MANPEFSYPDPMPKELANQWLFAQALAPTKEELAALHYDTHVRITTWPKSGTTHLELHVRSYTDTARAFGEWEGAQCSYDRRTDTVQKFDFRTALNEKGEYLGITKRGIFLSFGWWNPLVRQRPGARGYWSSNEYSVQELTGVYAVPITLIIDGGDDGRLSTYVHQHAAEAIAKHNNLELRLTTRNYSRGMCYDWYYQGQKIKN